MDYYLHNHWFNRVHYKRENIGQFMIQPIVDLKTWCERYGIKTTPIRCMKCKKMLEFKKPIAIKNYRGISCDENDHECGPNYTPFRVVPVGKSEIAIWNELRNL